MNRSLFQLLPGFLFKGVSGEIFRAFTFNKNALVAQKILGEENSKKAAFPIAMIMRAQLP